MKKQSIRSLAIASLAVLVLSACSSPLYSSLLKGAGAVLPAAAQVQQTSTPVAAPVISSQQTGQLAAFEDILENIYTQVNPSVVNIRVVDGASNSAQGFSSPNSPFGFPGTPDQNVQQALGSGFVWDNQGHIVTNNHVVDGATKIEVTFSDGTIAQAKLVGADPNSDLAVIQADVPQGISPVQVGDSSQVKVGQLAIAIGNPFGLQGTMTVGIISALGRSLPTNENTVAGPSFSIPNIIQTDAPINPGNSGGVLVNDQGQVIGVTAAIESASGSNSGIGFVIPTSLVQRVIPALIQTGHFDHPYLGISGGSLTPEINQAMNLPSDQRGVLVEEVVSGGPADKAGIQGSDRPITIDGLNALVGGDVIVAINGNPIKSMDELIAFLNDQTEVGQKVTLDILQNGRQKSVDVTLDARPSQQQVTQASQNGLPSTASARPTVGILVAPITADVAQAMNLPDSQQGVLIEQVQPGSPADQAGLHGGDHVVTVNGTRVVVGGDIITAVDGQTITGFEDLSAALQQAAPGQQVTFSILRDGQIQDVTLTLGG